MYLLLNMIAILIEQKPLPSINKGSEMSNVIVNFEFEKETKNSVRYKEVPEEGKAPIVGSIYVQKWFAGSSKNIAISIDKKD
ncbi:putative orphan protein [Marinomonas sp. MED121]|nr:putative orphan protein [Marinomonas sp. MED121]